jgi:hypothetical protein
MIQKKDGAIYQGKAERLHAGCAVLRVVSGLPQALVFPLPPVSAKEVSAAAADRLAREAVSPFSSLRSVSTAHNEKMKATLLRWCAGALDSIAVAARLQGACGRPGRPWL